MEKFRGIAHEEFVRFILTLYGAMPFTGQAQHIHGIANTRVVLSVGSGDPNERVSLAHVEGAVKDTLRQYQKQLGENDARILQIIGWSFDPPWTAGGARPSRCSTNGACRCPSS